MTDAEQAVWRRLRGKQVHGVLFYRRKSLDSYVMDFYRPAAHWVVEVDGSQHLEPEAKAYDKAREEYLTRQGLRVMRFDDRQVLCEGEAVMEVIECQVRARIGQIPPHPPFSKGGTPKTPLFS